MFFHPHKSYTVKLCFSTGAHVPLVKHGNIKD